MTFFFTGISIVCFVAVHRTLLSCNTCTCMHTVQDVRSCEYTQPPRAFTRTSATTRVRVKRVDMLYLGANTEGGRYFGWGLLRAFTVDREQIRGESAWDLLYTC